jgi:DNA polymerase-3 subunit alpha
VAERRVRAWGEQAGELVLLVMDEEGWINALALCNLGWLSGYDRGPRVDLRDLSRHSEGLLCLTGAPGVGLLPRALENVPEPTLPAEALALARQLASIFPDRLYLELAYHGQPLDRLVNRHVIAVGQRLDLPLVATGAVRFATPADALAHTALEAIAANKKVAGLVEARKNDLPSVALEGIRAQAHGCARPATWRACGLSYLPRLRPRWTSP